MIEVKNRYNGKVIFRSKKKTIKEAIELKVKNNTNLWAANLRSANLQDANLRSANLQAADLWGADLLFADLRYADLRVKIPPSISHNFISEILYREAKTEAQLDFSCRVGRQLDQCWEYFIDLARKKRVLKWAKEILFQWDEFREISKQEGGDE